MPTVPSASCEDLPSKAGITTDANGQRHIPSSVRADGSVRKEIRVRPGYRPPEDVELYKNRTAEAWKNRGKGGIPGADSLTESQDSAASAAANKNAKRREARKRAAAAKSEDGTVEGTKENGQPEAQKEEPEDPEVVKEKEAKKLAKKLRQARELKDKKDQGAALLPEQFEKVIRINELIRQLDALGFDAGGQKKETTEASAP
jgi:partner of Y14 and mago protein